MSKMLRTSGVCPGIPNPRLQLSTHGTGFQSDSLFLTRRSLRRLALAVLFVIMVSGIPLRAQNFNPNGLDAVKTMEEIQHPHDDLVILSSHRGDHALVDGQYPGVPENSLQAIGLSAQSGIEEVELDVKLTKDGIPILSHDLSWGREWCGLSPIPYQHHFDPFLPSDNYGNELANPLVNSKILADTRSLLGTTILRDSIQLVQNFPGSTMVALVRSLEFILRLCRMHWIT